MITSIKMNVELKKQVQHLAEKWKRSSHWIMLEAIRQYVEREESRENFKQEALDSWTSYQETGKHLTGKEVNHWLDTWGTTEEKGIPECHE